ncbi:MAG: cytochrome c biogenesis protein CcsA [Candidatus Zixiibacteriota bacterium]
MILGDLSLILALIASLGSSLFFFAGARRRGKLLDAARRTYYVFLFCTSFAAAYLLYLLLSHHFEVEYVYAYSSSHLPLFYLISSFWAGQEGTFLMWLFFGAILGIFLVRRSGSYQGYAMGVYLLVQVFLLVLLVKKSPFSLTADLGSQSASGFPAEGRGLNPLLQDFWMVIHPPIVFIGYAALAIPFSYAVAALIENKYKEWTRYALPWAVFSCLSLGAGIFIGGYWAYKVLGWGGYWGWDPVENASLVPWLLSIGLVHGLLAEKIKGSMRRANFVLAILCFLLVLYATFLTRSGILGDFSVHAFSDLGINTYLVAFTLFFAIFSLALFIFRLREIEQVEATGNPLSAEFVIFLAVTFLSVSAFLVLVGTSAPIVTRLFGPASNVGAAYYVNTQLPLGIIIAFVLGFAPFLTWAGSRWSGVRKAMLLPLVVSLVLTALALGFSVKSPLYLLLMFVSFFALSANLMVMCKKAKAGWRFTGPYLTHFAVALMLVGIITSSGYSRSITLNLYLNQTQKALGYGFTYLGTEGDSLNQDSALKVKVERAKRSFVARPNLYFSQYNQDYVRTPYIKISLLHDLYLAPLEHQGGGEAGTGRFAIKRGQTKEIRGYAVKFIGFDMSSHGMEGVVRVGAVLEVSHQEETKVVTPFVVVGDEDEEREAGTVPLPAGEDSLVLEKIDADHEEVTVRLLPAGGQPAGELLVLEVSRKPLISLLWLGTVLVMVGLLFTLRRRMGEMRGEGGKG